MINIIQELEEKGYVMIPNVLSSEEVNYAKNSFYKWKNSFSEFDYVHARLNYKCICRYPNPGHQEFAWYIRTRPNVRKVFETIWNTNELVTSFDVCCYMPQQIINDNYNWLHSDQSATTSDTLRCYQGLVSLTNNKERSLVVCEGSHLIHKQYLTKIGKGELLDNWQTINKSDNKYFEKHKKIVQVPAGGMIIWDSRCFHQNTFGPKQCSEERIVQYVCMFPKNTSNYNENDKITRRSLFNNKISTTHWPYPVQTIPVQPPRNEMNIKINYDLIQKNNLSNLDYYEIEKLI